MSRQEKLLAFHRLDNRDWTPKGAGAAWPQPSSKAGKLSGLWSDTAGVAVGSGFFAARTDLVLDLAVFESTGAAVVLLLLPFLLMMLGVGAPVLLSFVASAALLGASG